MKETIEFDILAIIIASLLGIILHALHLLPEEFIVSLILLLLALHALHSATESSKHSEVHTRLLEAADKLEDPEIRLIPSQEIFRKGEDLALRNRGEMWWFNTPLGFKNQKIFDQILKPAMENPRTKKISFILDQRFKETWEKDVKPKINKTKGHEKVEEPRWRSIREKTAFRMIDTQTDKDEKEAHLTILERPFIMHIQNTEKEAFHPRYMFHVKSHSKLIQDLKDLYLEYKLKQ